MPDYLAPRPFLKVFRILLKVNLFLCMTGCAIGHTTNYLGDLSFQIPQTKTKNEIIVAVQDKRPRTLSGTDSPSRVGTLRSIAGVPWSIKTSTGAPLANDFGESINKKFIGEGFQSRAIAVLPSDNESDVRAKAFSQSHSGSLLHFTLLEWETENWFGSKLNYCVDLSASTYDQTCNSRTKLCDEKSLPSSTPGFDDLSTAIGTIFTSLLKDPGIASCLGLPSSPSQDPPRPKTGESGCSTEKILKLHKAGITKEDIEEACGK